MSCLHTLSSDRQLTDGLPGAAGQFSFTYNLPFPIFAVIMK